MNIGAEILEELGRDTIYNRPSSGETIIKAIIRDRGVRTRVGRASVLTSDAVATVSDQVVYERNGTLTQGGTTYRLDGKQVGAPGQSMWTLSRLEGDRLEGLDTEFADAIVNDFDNEFIIWNDQIVSAHVVRTSEKIEFKKSGAAVQVLKTIASVKVTDVDGLKIRDEVILDGITYKIEDTDRNGFGIVDLTLGR